MYKLSVYEKAMPGHIGWKEKLNAAKEAGYDGVELSVDESDERLSRLDWSAAQRLDLLRASRETGVRLPSLCLSGHRRYPLGSRDPETVRRGMAILEKAVRLAGDLGIRLIQLAGYDVYYEPSAPDTAARFAENLQHAVSIAAADGVTLGFETMETPFMNTTAKAMTHIRREKSPYLQIYPDIGNITNAVPDAVRDLQSGRGHIAAAHLKETRPGVYRDLYYGEGEVNFSAVIRELMRQGVRLYTAEFWYREGTDWRRELSRARTFLQERFTEAEA